MKTENIPTTQPAPAINIPVSGLSNDSLTQIIEVLNREGTTISRYPGPEMDLIARHYDRQLHVALAERFARNLAAARIRQDEANLRLLGATVSHSNSMQIPA
jgi:GGDEF domain-containing protein